MKRWQTSRGNDIYQVLSGRSNAYLVSAGEYSMLVDTGPASAYRRLKRNIRSLTPQIGRMRYLVLTHTHFDHCQNAAAIQREFNCRVVVPDREVNYAQEGYTPLPSGTFLLTQAIVALGRLVGRRHFGYDPFVPDMAVGGGFEFSRDRADIRLVATPGHSPGSASITVDGEVAIVGDAMFGVLKQSVFPPFADDVQTMVRSWDTLLHTGCSLFLPGHGKEIVRERLAKAYAAHVPAGM